MQDHWKSLMYGSTTKTGRMVNETNALAVSAVWSCLQVYSNTMAMVPLNVYRKDKNKRVLADDLPIYSLLHSRPNSLMTSFTWRRTAMMQCAANGNSYTIIRRNDRTGRIDQLDLTQNPRDVSVYLIEGKLWYEVKGETNLIPAYNMIHFRWNSTDGIIGKSPIEVARETIGQVLAIQEYGSRVFTEGGGRRVALISPGRLNDDQKKSFRTTWKEEYGGVENLHNVAILEGGGDLKEIGMNPQDAQFVEVSKFKIEEIARIYNVPLHMIQSLDHATNNNIEHQSMQFVTHTMMPHYVNWEQELDFKLFEMSAPYYTKHVLNSLLRGDAVSRGQWYRTMADLGVYSVNDILRKEDENPIEGGDGHYVQVNRIPLDKMDQVEPKQSVRQLVEDVLKSKNGKHHHENTAV